MNSSAEKECGNCNFKDRWLLHNLRLRGEYRQLCTSCVLKLHPTSFCPVCFNLFESSLPQHDRITCQKCQSITHLGCCIPNSDKDKPHTCPPCSNPSFRYFDVKRNGEDQFEIDLKHAKALLCAARIASDSMARAARMAEADAMRKVKEAVVSKKRAREGLEEICAREKERKLREDSSYGGLASQNRVSNSTTGGMVLASSVSVPRGLTNNQGGDQRGKRSVNGVSSTSMNVNDAGNTR